MDTVNLGNKKPKTFLLENVKGLVNINNGGALKEIISLLGSCV